jgi:tetratricopeptide (TPR) repeat protein
MDFSKPAETVAEHVEAQLKDTLNISRSDYLLTEFRVIVTYLRLLVFPVKQSIDYTYPVFHSFMQSQVFLSFLLLVSIFSLGIYLFSRSRFFSPGLRLIAFGIFWFFITLSVESTIIPIKDVIFEHRLYLPSVGFFMAAITSIEYFIREPKARIGLVIVCVVIFSVSTYNRNKVWQDPQALWEDVLHKFPTNVRAFNALGVIFKNESDYDKAAEQFEKILTINSEYPPAYYNLGDIRLSLGDYEGAINYFKKTLTLKLSNQFRLDTLNSLAIAYSEMGDSSKAVSTFKEAIGIYPKVISPYNNLGRQYIKMGEADLAIQVLEKGLQIRETPHLYYNLARAYDLKNDKTKSGLMKQKAMRMMN